MGKYGVTYSCGHEDLIELFGPYEDRQRKIQWLEESGLCPACYRAKKEAEAAELFGELPPLTGSPKQVAWAEKLRRGAIIELQKEVEHANSQEFREYLIAVSRRILSERTEAKWWIDNKVNGLDARIRFEEETAGNGASQ